MLHNLLVDTAEFRQPKPNFNGLGDEPTSSPIQATVCCRIRQLSERELYMAQGDDNVSTHRVYLEGCLSDHPYVSPENIVEIHDVRYRIQTIREGKTLESHHLEVDVIRAEGDD